MAKPKKNQEEIVSQAAESIVPDIDVRTALLNLLKSKTPGIFEREPNSGFVVPHLERLADEIIKLTK